MSRNISAHEEGDFLIVLTLDSEDGVDESLTLTHSEARRVVSALSNLLDAY